MDGPLVVPSRAPCQVYGADVSRPKAEPTWLLRFIDGRIAQDMAGDVCQHALAVGCVKLDRGHARGAFMHAGLSHVIEVFRDKTGLP